MFAAALVFATFYSKNGNFHHSVTKRSNMRAAVLKGGGRSEGAPGGFMSTRGRGGWHADARPALERRLRA